MLIISGGFMFGTMRLSGAGSRMYLRRINEIIVSYCYAIYNIVVFINTTIRTKQLGIRYKYIFLFLHCSDLV